MKYSVALGLTVILPWVLRFGSLLELRSVITALVPSYEGYVGIIHNVIVTV